MRLEGQYTMMNDDECISFMSKLAEELDKAFSATIQKHLPRDTQIPLDTISTGIAMFVATAIEQIYRTGGVPADIKKAAVKEFCVNLEKTILLMIKKKSVH